MRIVLLGATGMIGQGVLRACLAATDVEEIIVLGRRAPAGINDARLRPVVADLSRFDAADPLFADVDACFFCVGVSSFGMSEQDYRRITHDLTLQVVTELQRRSPRMHLVYVSGAGADSSERSRTMWARVRGRTENALLALGLPEVAIFRPAMIVPEAGIQSRTRAYRLMYALLRPLLGPLRRLFPDSVLSTAVIGQAMLEVARHGSPQAILAPAQINRLGQPR